MCVLNDHPEDEIKMERFWFSFESFYSIIFLNFSEKIVVAEKNRKEPKILDFLENMLVGMEMKNPDYVYSLFNPSFMLVFYWKLQLYACCLQSPVLLPAEFSNRKNAVAVFVQASPSVNLNATCQKVPRD